jgi:hypothetical protein
MKKMDLRQFLFWEISESRAYGKIRNTKFETRNRTMTNNEHAFNYRNNIQHKKSFVKRYLYCIVYNQIRGILKVRKAVETIAKTLTKVVVS